MLLFMPIAASRDESLGSAYAEWQGDSCSSPADLTFFLSVIFYPVFCSFWFFNLIIPFQRRLFLYRYFQELSIWFIFYFQYSMKQKNNVSLRWPGKITKVRKGGLQMIQPSPKQLHRSAFPPTREQIYDGSRAGKCR